MPCIHEMAEQLRAWEKYKPMPIEIQAYVGYRNTHTYESLKNAGYANVDELERIYQEMME